MKNSVAAATVLFQLILLFLCIGLSDWLLYTVCTALLISVLLGIIFTYTKKYSSETKELGKGILLGTAITVILAASVTYWFSRNFSR